MAFQQGLSGLNASSTALDVIGNNIANSSTVGFKAANAHFADVYASMMAGSGASQIGIGTTVMAIQQEFTQGNVTTTKDPLDIAINGDGFFRMSNQDTITFSRNGQFHVDKNGYIIDDRTRRLTGYPADANGKVIQSAPQELQLFAGNQPPVATGTSGGAFQGVRASFNLDSRKDIIDPAAPTAFAPNNVNSYNWSTSTSIFDSLGNPHTLTFYASKRTVSAANSTWDMNFTVDGAATNPANMTLTFDTSGRLTAPAAPENLSFAPGNGAAPLNFPVNFAGTTQTGSLFAANSLEQDGYTTGRLINVSVAKDGVIRGNYSNGQARDMGQVVLAGFTDPNGLMSLGGNQWAETATSGPPLVGIPTSAKLGVLQSAAVEESNTDLTAELVKMIVQQRNYQANAQTIKTQDQIMQTLVNLR